MMFLEFFIWGAWYVTMGTYITQALGANGKQLGYSYSAFAIATIISPFFVGMVADKFFAAQRVLGVLHILGAALFFYATTLSNPNAFIWIIFLYSLCYAPTLALVNSVAFRQMGDTTKQFASIRVLGTLGWIVAGWAITLIQSYPISPYTDNNWWHKVLNFLMPAGNTIGNFLTSVLKTIDNHFASTNLNFTFILASIFSLLLGLISFTLPSTPPKAKGTKTTFAQILGVDAFVLFKNRSFTVFFIASILICIPLSFYYSLTNLFLTESGMKDVTFNMTFGQWSEGFFILLIPFFFRRLGVKWMIAVGMIAWSIRFLLFGYGDTGPNLWMFFAGIILHGVCFDFFFVTGQIYTDSKAEVKIQSSAQGMITLATYGIGMFIGTILSGVVKDVFTVDKIVQWKSVWMIPAAIALAVLIMFVFFFRDKASVTKEPNASSEPAMAM